MRRKIYFGVSGKKTEITIKMIFAIILAVIFRIPYVAAQEYKIGDTGPAGGIVFYVRENAPQGEWRYLEAAPADLPEAAWGAYKVDIDGTETRAGSGKKNTGLIVAKLREIRESGKAAQRCTGYEVNGYRDWFLPSKDELDLMYKNLKKKGLGNFTSKIYWSSSEEGISYEACYHDFGDGSQYYGHRGNAYCVRAIRAF
jgi:hypothetical protein